MQNITESELLKVIEINPYDILLSKNLRAVLLLQEKKPSDFAKIREAVKKSGVTLKVFETSLKQEKKALKSEMRKEKISKNNEIKLSGNKPSILVAKGQADNIIKSCCSLLNVNDVLYERGGIARITSTRFIDDEILKTDFSIEILGPESVKTHLNRYGNFLKVGKEGDMLDTDCPLDVPGQIVNLEPSEWGLKPLTGILKTPTINTKGRIISEQGYDEKTGLFVCSSLENFNPDMDTKPALRVLNDLICEFPFVNEVDYGVAFAALLTAVARPILPTAPLFAIDANCAGSGKSCLADIINSVAQDVEPSKLSLGEGSETEKRLDAAVVANDPVIFIDNVEGPIKSEKLCIILSERRVAIRELGYTRLLKVPSKNLWLITGNNLNIIGDLTRRVLRCRLDAGMEYPEERVFKGDPVNFIKNNRGLVVSSVVSLLNNFIQSGVQPSLSKFGSYDAWSDFIRGACVWMGITDPVLAKNMLKENDPERENLKCLLKAWNNIFGEKGVTLKKVSCVCNDVDNYELSEALDPWTFDGQTQTVKLGRFIREKQNQIVDGLKFVKDGTYQNKILWSVVSG